MGVGKRRIAVKGKWEQREADGDRIIMSRRDKGRVGEEGADGRLCR